MTSPQVTLVQTTVGGRKQADHLASQLVESKLSACVSITEVESYYVWDDTIQNDQEYELTVKTLESLTQKIRDWLREHHPYDCPEIVEIPVKSINESYKNWIKEHVSKKNTS